MYTELVSVLSDFMFQLELFMPKLLKILVIIVGGWIFAGVMQWTVSKFLIFVKFDIAADKAGLVGLMKKGNIKRTPAQLVGSFIYWIILFWILISVVNAVGLTIVAQGLDDLWQYLPKVIGAIIILVIGLFCANVLSGVVRTGISSAGISQANILGTVTKYAIAIFTITVTLRQLGITGVSMVFNIFFAAVCLGLALAFGLGCKDLAGRWVGDMIKQYREKK